MLGRFFRKPRAKAFSGPAGSRAYAVGDVHGRLDLLESLLDKIAEDNRARGSAKTYLVMLGDLIDRGPDSAGVIDLFANRPPQWARVINLKGNHEEFLLRVLGGDADLAPNWLTYGGYECVESYGMSRGWSLDARPQDIVEQLAAKVPQSHREFLEDMADSFKFGDYLFVHAGIRPGVPIAEQSGKDLRWIRDGFLDDQTEHGVMVVHGHTIVDTPQEHFNRIAIDTGAYKSGVLTALALEGEARWYIEARG